MITLDDVKTAVAAGADTYRKIAANLGVSLEDPDLAASINWLMNLHHELAFADGCCDNSVEHTYDCRIVAT